MIRRQEILEDLSLRDFGIFPPRHQSILLRKGDSYSWLALDADSKMVLAHHVGRRTSNHADAFVEKLDRGTTKTRVHGYPDPARV